MKRDDNLKDLLIQKEQPKLSADFDTRLMGEIEIVHKRSQSDSRSLKLAWLFFAIGIIAGLALSYLITDAKLTLYNIDLSQYKIIIQVLVCGVLLWLFDKMYQISKDKDAVFE